MFNIHSPPATCLPHHLPLLPVPSSFAPPPPAPQVPALPLHLGPPPLAPLPLLHPACASWYVLLPTVPAPSGTSYPHHLPPFLLPALPAWPPQCLPHTTVSHCCGSVSGIGPALVQGIEYMVILSLAWPGSNSCNGGISSLNHGPQ